MNTKVLIIAKSDNEICTTELASNAVIIGKDGDVPILSFKKGTKIGELEIMELILSDGKIDVHPTKNGIIDIGYGILLRVEKSAKKK